jgi:class 3 adenylate cyclase/predicted ATPase/DNA polymerase III delta prime subunit
MTAWCTADKVRIAQWLKRQGLAQYARAFKEHNIGFDVLPELGDEDLKELGVPLGDRKRLLKAIADLRVALESAGDAMTSAAARGPPIHRVDPERRQLTLLFCDLVASTELSARLDPEDLREVVHAYQACVAAVVERFEGHVAKYLGDGVLVYFGYPRAHEDDAERAVLAGLELVHAVAKLRIRPDVELEARVGIATGEVVVGGLVGQGSANEDAAIGATPNLAARLLALGEPGNVIINRRTRRLVGDLFEVASLGAHHLKGFSEPVQTWRVIGEGFAESRFEALRGASLTPLVGRDHELGLLLERWHWAKEGEGQVVLLSGEPGIGKSRLIRALLERLGGESYMPLSHYCSPYHQNSAFYPVISLLERAGGLSRTEPPECQIEKLEALLSRSTEQVEAVAPLFAALLAIPTGSRYPPLELSPERQKARTFEALLDQMEGLARRQPVLSLYEDLHWVDPSTRELLGLMVDRARRLPVLVIMTFRPDFVPPWTRRTHVTPIALGHLSRRQSIAMIERLTGGRALPPTVLDQILAKTEGVPLFVEELTKTVLASGLLKNGGDRYKLAGPLPQLAIPTTLQDSLMARLDRLAPVKEVAQIAAVIGREFSYELLAAITPLSADDLAAALDQLLAADLVHRRGTPPDNIFCFKHALVRDAAYASLVERKRRRLHLDLVHALEQRFQDATTGEPEILAHHATRAGLADKAMYYWRLAGEQALARSATTEAVAQLDRGLELLVCLPDGPERQRLELGLQLVLGPALIAARGFAAPETGRAYARACELCRELGDIPKLLPALYGQSVVRWQRAELAAAHEGARELLRLAQEQGDAAAEVVGHRTLGTFLFHLGRLAESHAHSESGLALYDPVRDRNSRFVYAIDSRVVCLLWLSQALLALGYPEQAQVRQGEALAAARELAHPNTIAQALFCDWTLHQLLRNGQAAQAQAEALIALTTEQGLPLWLAAGVVIRGWALAAGGRAEDGIAVIRRGLADYRATGAELFSPYFLALLADAHGRADQAAIGLSLLADALDGVGRTGVRWIEAELHRLEGELRLALPEPDQSEAEAYFLRAMAIAREQQAKLWELRAATSVGRLWAEQGRRAEALDLLAPVYGWFTEGFDTADLIDAKALLDEVG